MVKVFHFEVDDEIAEAFNRYKKEGNYPSAKVAFCNLTEITSRTSKNYMVVKTETRGRKVRGRTPKFLSQLSHLEANQPGPR